MKKDRAKANAKARKEAAPATPPAGPGTPAEPRTETKASAPPVDREDLQRRLKDAMASKKAGRGGGAALAPAGMPSQPAPGPVLKPGQRLVASLYGPARVAGPGANLRNADLTGADLSGLDLSDADLRGAILEDAQMEGARLRGALLARADLADATGVDLTGARLHPFFESGPGEPVGTVRVLNLDAPRLTLSHKPAGHPFDLQVTPESGLTWLQERSEHVYAMFRNGYNSFYQGSRSLGDTLKQALAVDCGGRTWSFGDGKVFCNFPTPDQGFGKVRCKVAFLKAAAGDRPGRAAAGADFGGWAVPDFRPRPDRFSKYPKGRERDAFLDRLAQGANARFEARPAVELEPAPERWEMGAEAADGKSQCVSLRAGGGAGKADGKGEGGPAGSASSAPARKDVEGLSPREVLAALNVNLAPRAARHILAQHGHGRKDDRSQFGPRVDGGPALEAIIAQGLLEAGDAMARIKARPRHQFDQRGRYLTRCTLRDAGRYCHFGQFRGTDSFVVVTELQYTDDGPTHDVVTAYPVSDYW